MWKSQKSSRRCLRAFAIVSALVFFIPAVGMVVVIVPSGYPPSSGLDTEIETSVPQDPDLSWINLTLKDYLPALGIDPTGVEYYQNISEVFGLNSTQWNLLSRNGFVVVESGNVTTFEEAYEFYWENDLPVFITTDTILNTFHLLFDQFLKNAEKEVLGPSIEEMTSELLRDSQLLRNETFDYSLRTQMEDVVVFFAIPSELMERGDYIPDYAQERVDMFVENIMEAQSIHPTDDQDYSQYEPRGHYAGDPYLEKYFRTMMWFGRKSYDTNETEQTLKACLISLVLLSNDEALEKWQMVYNFTSSLVGRSDSLSSFDIVEAMKASLGGVDFELLSDMENVLKIKKELEKDMYYRQRILSEVVYKEPGDVYDEMVFPKIFQFMGQRYIPDSEIMQNVMYDRVGLFNGERRGLPSALDVMAAFGSSRAIEHLKEELATYNYSKQLGGAIESVRNKTEDYWNQSVFFGMMRSYSELISGVEDEDYPDFMETAAWADEKLNSVLGSWTELKHDTILYGKQPYSMGIGCSTPDGIVEPYPDFYARIENLSFMMRDIIAENLDPESHIAKRYADVFHEFATINRNLTLISIHELQGIALTQEEIEFVRNIFVELLVGCGRPLHLGWLPELINRAGVEDKVKDTRIIVDVATDPGTYIPVPSPPRVLHVATGCVRSVIVAYLKPDGSLHFLVGPVYSFYEFEVEGFERLNDDEWRSLLTSGNSPSVPLWTSSFVA